MKITPLTIFFAAFAVLMIIIILSKIKKDTISLRSALVWLGLMAGIGFFSLFPEFLDWFIRISQMKERMIFVLLVAVFVLLAFIFNLNARYERLERKWTKTVQELALLSYRIDDREKDKTGRPEP